MYQIEKQKYSVEISDAVSKLLSAANKLLGG
jgi:hypothetical protein